MWPVSISFSKPKLCAFYFFHLSDRPMIKLINDCYIGVYIQVSMFAVIFIFSAWLQKLQIFKCDSIRY